MRSDEIWLFSILIVFLLINYCRIDMVSKLIDDQNEVIKEIILALKKASK